MSNLDALSITANNANWRSILWGGVEMAFAGAQDFRGVAALRFVLGFCEGAVSPAFVVLTANFYKRREHPFRVA